MPESSRVPWYGRITWQLALSYLLGGAVSVLLLAGFAYVAVNMLLVRGAVNTVERQIELAVQMAAGRLELMTHIALLQAASPPGPRRPDSPRRPLRPGEPGPRGGRGPRSGAGLQGSRARLRCQSEDGAVLERVIPPGPPLEIPAWLTADRFEAVTFDENGPVIRAFSRTEDGDCVVEALVETSINERLREMISRATGLDIELARGRPGRVDGKKGGGPPSLTTMAWSNLVGRFDRGTAALVTGYDWRDGDEVRRPVFFVRPNTEIVWRQMTQLGAQHRRWVWGLATLAGAFLAVELIAVGLAVGLARRVVRSTNLLTEAAARLAAGDLRHRIPVRRNDQLGQVAATFNRMAESIERLLETTKRTERLEEELRIARQLQESLYPRELPQLEHARLAALCRPARNVSGDLYDLIELGPGRVGLLCADVSGKGIPAALLTSNIQALVRALLRGQNGERPTPAALLARINRELVHRIPDNAFVTMFWAEYDARSRLLRWCNAGHCPPLLLLADRRETWLAASGVPVGVMDRVDYLDQEAGLPEGSVLVAYTDGVTEAECADGEAFGE